MQKKSGNNISKEEAINQAEKSIFYIQKIIKTHKKDIAELIVRRNKEYAHKDLDLEPSRLTFNILSELIISSEEILNTFGRLFGKSQALTHLTHDWDIDPLLLFSNTHFEYYKKMEEELLK